MTFYTNTTKNIIQLGGAVAFRPGINQVDNALNRQLNKRAIFKSYLSDGSILEGNHKPEDAAKMAQAKKTANAPELKAPDGKSKSNMKKPQQSKPALTAAKPPAPIEGKGNEST